MSHEKVLFVLQSQPETAIVSNFLYRFRYCAPYVNLLTTMTPIRFQTQLVPPEVLQA